MKVDAMPGDRCVGIAALEGIAGAVGNRRRGQFRADAIDDLACGERCGLGTSR